VAAIEAPLIHQKGKRGSIIKKCIIYPKATNSLIEECCYLKLAKEKELVKRRKKSTIYGKLNF